MGKEASLNELRISNEEYEALTKCQPEVRYQYITVPKKWINSSLK